MNRRSRILFAFLLFASLFVSFDLFASTHVLRRGREKDILALFAPYTLGSKVNATWSLWSVSIEPRRIDLRLRESSGREEPFSLIHPEDGTDKPEKSKSFALVHASAEDPALQQAATLLFTAVKKNDAGGYWETPKIDALRPASDAPGDVSSSGSHRANDSLFLYISDGIVTIVLIWFLGILLAIRLLRESPKWIRIALPTTVLAGIAVRLALSPAAFLGAWPWSRLWSNIRTVFEGPLLQEWIAHSGQTVFLTDVMMWTNFAYAAVMPLILFSHATYLLRDPRAGITASFLLAFLPQHIRFSRCEDAFVPSLVLTSLAFALIHAWLRDPAKTVRMVALLVMPFVLYLGYLLRPLNILFVAVYCVAMVFLHPETAPKERRIVGLFVVIGAWLAALPSFISNHESTVEKVLGDLRWLGGVIKVILTPQLLVLTDIHVTPLVIVVFAGAGAHLAWRAGEKRLVLFLTAWLLLFVVTHAVVVTPPMQPRYHMHLVVPFLLLAAKSAPYLWEKARPGFLVACAVIVVSPWLHRHWISDLHYAEMLEYSFVRAARDVIPAGCSVVEYVGTRESAKDSRFTRIGTLQAPSGSAVRYRVAPVFGPDVIGEETKPFDDLLKDLPACAYLYEGLECIKEKAGADCATLRRNFSLEPMKRTEIQLEFYDRKVGDAVNPSTKHTALELFRVKSVNQH